MKSTNIIQYNDIRYIAITYIVSKISKTYNYDLFQKKNKLKLVTLYTKMTLNI